MSKAIRKHRPIKKQIPQPTTTNRKIIFLVFIAILAAIPFGLGKYIEFNSPDPYDSSANVYSAEHILEGAKMGVDERPAAALATLIVNMLGVWFFGFNEIGPKLIQAIFQVGALILMFFTMRKLFGILPAAVGVIIASVYLSSPLIAKFGNVKDQFMIALMIIGISLFVLRQLGGKWWLSLLSGMVLSWAPLFKETGTSAIGAIGLFVIIQPILKHRSWKQTVADVGLLLGGAIAALAPLYIWLIAEGATETYLPYLFVWKEVKKILPMGAVTGQTEAIADYVTSGRKLIPFSKQWPRVLRYYSLFRLPIALATGAIITRLSRMVVIRLSRSKTEQKNYERFVLLFAIWWVLDMAFVWISPRSYEQYYLPLNASAAMLGGYLIAVYCDKLRSTAYNKTIWKTIGLAGLLLMIIMSWHIFFGIEKSPHSGVSYGRKQRGYSQGLAEISLRRRKNLKGHWEIVGEYIRGHSEPTDKIYVWGWMPGIYLKAQRFSSASRAFCMPRPAPQQMVSRIDRILVEFENHRPKFIVDSRKIHVPLDRPPYELWPIAPKGFMGLKKTWFLPLNEHVIAAYDEQWAEMLRTRFDEDEALRYEALAPFRKFVMDNYEVVEPELYVLTKDRRLLFHRLFGEHVVFKLKESTSEKEP